MLPTSDGHYILYKVKEAVSPGEHALLYPAPAGEYYLLKPADASHVGKKIVIVSDGKGYYGVSP